MITTNQELSPKALCLAELISCCLNALDHFQVKPGDVVAVLGAGPIGLLHTQLALACRAGRAYISNRSKGQCTVADRLDVVGVTPEELNPQVEAATARVGADIAVVHIGASELTQSVLKLATIGGRVNFFTSFPKGLSAMMEPNLIHCKGLRAAGGSSARRRDVKRTIALLESEAINAAEVITHEFPLSRVAEAYEAMNQRVDVKIAMIPD